MNSIAQLFDIVRRLRAADGCPWDRKQTPETMFKCLLEESYELQEALAKNDPAHILEELGDVLFQLVFIIEIFQEQGMFSVADVAGCVAEKMIRRHPHVYQDAADLSEKELDDQWRAIKAEEARENGVERGSVMDRVPRGMPALVRALNVSKAAVKEGFDWDDTQGVLETVRDEIQEFEEALAVGNRAEASLEFGDILFSLVNVARFSKIYPETALADSTAKFEGRFRVMEEELKKTGSTLNDLPRERIDALWEEAKRLYDR